MSLKTATQPLGNQCSNRISSGGWELLVSIDNLLKDLATDQSQGRVMRFVDTILTTNRTEAREITPSSLFWCLEPNDYVEKADFRVPISKYVDRVLVHLARDQRTITWVSSEMLKTTGLSQDVASDVAFKNLARAMSESKVEFKDIDGVKLGLISPSIPMKTSLILAPNLKDEIQNILGWPLMAVAPDGDFLFLWAAEHRAFVNRVGGEVVRQYRSASCPLSTEVYSITDQGVETIGEFPRGSA